MQHLKKILYKILPLNLYIYMLHYGFLYSFKFNLLKNNNIYKNYYFVHNFIKSGDVVLDIGANLGYFLHTFYDLVKPSGMVIAIEPVPMYFKLLKKLFGNIKEITLYNYALGEENKTIQIAMPKTDGKFRSGLFSLIKQPNQTNEFSYDVVMKKGSELLAGLNRLDLLKIDIEGYEEIVIKDVFPIIQKFSPTIMLEQNEDSIDSITQSLKEIGYTEYFVTDSLYLKKGRDNNHADSILIHSSREESILNPIKEKKLYIEA